MHKNSLFFNKKSCFAAQPHEALALIIWGCEPLLLAVCLAAV
jgi:hypothetical protein